MNTRMKNAIAASGLVSLAAALISTAALAQESARTPTGTPDLSGTWQAMTSAHYHVAPPPADAGPH